MNVAVIEWVATVSELVANVAWPPDTLCGAPRLFPPSLNCTVPAAAGDTVAVKVTGVPASAGEAGEAPSVVVVPCAGGGLMT